MSSDPFRGVFRTMRSAPTWAVWSVLVLAMAVMGTGSKAGDTDTVALMDAAERVRIEVGALTGHTLLCFFDPIDTGLAGCVELDSSSSMLSSAVLAGLIEGRLYGWYTRHEADSREAVSVSDTVFGVWERPSHSLLLAGLLSQTGAAAGDSTGVSPASRAHNYPNPFNPKEETTTIVYRPSRGGAITMMIYDLFGHLVYEEVFPGAEELSWSGRNGRGELVGSGGYICVLKMGNEVVSRHKIAVVK